MFEHPEIRTLPRRDDGCRGIDALLEPYVDDLIEPAERSRVDSHLATCAACARQLALAQRVKHTLHQLPAQTFPPALLPATGGRARRVSLLRRLRLRGPGGVTGRSTWAGAVPAWIGAGVAAAAATLLAIGLSLRPAPAPDSRQQVAQAEAEVKLALAYLGRIGARTGDIVTQDVLEAQVAGPIVRSVRKVLEPPAAEPRER